MPTILEKKFILKIFVLPQKSNVSLGQASAENTNNPRKNNLFFESVQNLDDS